MTNPNIGLFRFSSFLLFGIVFLILAGGLVTSHEAGLAVPDWPLSYGQMFPPMVGNIFWEHGHRMIAGTVGILTLILAILIQKIEQRTWLKKLGWIALGAVVLQALLGGLTVLLMLPPAVSVLHACLAQTFLCIVLAITYFLSPTYILKGSKQVLPVEMKRTKRFMMATTGVIFFQLILGAILRHAGHALIFHVLFAFVVFVHVVMASVRMISLPNDPGAFPQLKLMKAAGAGMGVAVVFQVFLGFGSLIFTRMLERGYAPSLGEVVFTSAHQTTGALVLALSVLMTLLVWK